MAWNKITLFGLRRKGYGRSLPDGVAVKCPDCGEVEMRKTVENNLHVCPHCSYHFRIGARERLRITLDENSFQERHANLRTLDPLNFRGVKTYGQKIEEARRETGLEEAAVVGSGAIEGHRCLIGATDSRFIMGSMGAVLGEKVTRLIEDAAREKLPLIIVSGSGGGARMYEGVLSLAQMAKTSAALARLDEAGGFYVSVLTNPTMAGVYASFASLGDVMLAEPKALIGFTGPRVIQQTIRENLPEGFQLAEFLLEHGQIDRIVDRREMRAEFARLLDYARGAGSKEPG